MAESRTAVIIGAGIYHEIFDSLGIKLGECM